jgi:hypothetical protein
MKTVSGEINIFCNIVTIYIFATLLQFRAMKQATWRSTSGYNISTPQPGPAGTRPAEIFA